MEASSCSAHPFGVQDASSDYGQLSGIISMRDCVRQISEAAKSKALQLIEHMEEKCSVRQYG